MTEEQIAEFRRLMKAKKLAKLDARKKEYETAKRAKKQDQP